MTKKVPISIAGGILNSVEDLLAPKGISLPSGVKRELEELRNKVSDIRTMLRDAGDERVVITGVDGWLEGLSDALSDADDFLDAASTKTGQRELKIQNKKAKKVLIFFFKSILFVSDIRMAHKIKAISRALDPISTELGKFEFMQTRDIMADLIMAYVYTPRDYSVAREEVVIGRKVDKKVVVDRLLGTNDGENVSVIPIVGEAGLGKTMLAQYVFNDQEIQNHFELRMWVEVSHSFNVKIIVQNILEYVTKEKSEPLEMDALISHLKERINGKKFLLVLDDVWNEDPIDVEYCKQWFNLKEILMGSAIGSKILVTTRNKVVSSSMEIPHVLEHLRGEDSMNLFMEAAFGKHPRSKTSTYEKIVGEVTENCAGNPLALKTMGRLLGSLAFQWGNFIDIDLSYVRREGYSISSILNSHYKGFPQSLKYCFVYCSLFPKNYKFSVSTLISLWIAEGFIEPSRTQQCLEDIGYSYFRYLLWSSFFHQVELDEFNVVIRCSMPNLVHDLALSLAGELICGHREITINESTRHVANYSSIGQISSFKGNKIRTYLCLGVSKYFSDKIDCEEIFSSFKLLRVLDLRDKKLKCLPHSISKLRHLRYLDLSDNNEIVKLPDSITEIYNLWTLILSGCWLLEELPRDIRKLVKLSHLEIEGCWGLRHMPKGLGQLTKLQTLSMFVVNEDSCLKNVGGLNELSQLGNLKGHLCIQYLSHAKGVASKYAAANLMEKSRLRGLDLNWSFEGDRDVSNIIEDEEGEEDNLSLENLQPHQNLCQLCLKGYWGSKVPEWILTLTCLVELKLSWCPKCRYLPPLNKLLSLKRLRLWNMDVLEYISDFDYRSEPSSTSSTSMSVASFESLEELWLSDCPKLKRWWRDDNSIIVSFPCLSKLKIVNCPLSTWMPSFPHLEELYLYNAKWEPPQQIMMNTSPLSKLKHVELHSIKELEVLPEEWMQNLITLKTLTIERCDQLKSLSPCIEHLTTLEHLDLRSCSQLEITDDSNGMQWKGLQSLLSLSLKDLPKLMSLPLGLKHVTTLQNLEISYCTSLTVIPEWIHDSESLEGLKIIHCCTVTSLPKRMRRKFLFEGAKD